MGRKFYVLVSWVDYGRLILYHCCHLGSPTLLHIGKEFNVKYVLLK